ncbi:hypothetical protein Ddye_008790 [Dipteronia dyeriana]|uniref:Receptor-like protein 12 n=1 Tax=Dipteronia dyeriana TaxID=168575 RepID=A0AAE0CM91_9ROSI|nr:hypothetical protein Ddye_008790 [Dipteronia dyeriana]
MPTEYYYFRINKSSYGYCLTVNIEGVNMKYEKISNTCMGILLSNKFTGEIPASIASLKVLQAQNLSNNDLGGHIPSSLGNFTTLESLDPSYNKLSGEIPQQLAVLTVSHNNLVGLVPHGNQFDTLDNSSFDGNPGSCRKPLSRKCENSEALESPFVSGWNIVLLGYASGLIVGLVLGQEFYVRKHEWSVKFFGERFKRIKGQRGRSN